MAATPESIELTYIAARAASEGKATSITAIDVSERLVLTDVFLVISGSDDVTVEEPESSSLADYFAPVYNDEQGDSQ